MKLSVRRLSMGIVFAGIAIAAFPGLLWASVDSPQVNMTGLRRCYESFNSGTFQIHEKVGTGVAARITNAFTNKVSSLLETASDARFAHDQNLIRSFHEDVVDFDLLQEATDQHIEKTEWSLDPRSDQILDDCYAALHPNEKPQ